MLAQIQIGNGQRYRLAAPAVLHQAGDVLAGGLAVAVHLLHQDPLAGEGEDILLHTFDDLRSGKQGLPGKPHNAGFIVGPAVFAKQLQRLPD